MYTPQQLRYLDAMGIPAWIERNHDAPAQIESASVATEQDSVATDPRVPTSPTPLVHWLGSECLSAVSRSAATAQSKAVYLTGPAQARLLVISDQQLDSSNTPFSGSSGKLFQAMLQAIALSRSSVLIGTTVTTAWSSESTSDAAVDIATALDSVGANSVRAILFYTCSDGSHGYSDINELRDVSHKLESGIPCVVSYHPSWLLKNAELKRAAWNDLKRVRQLLD